MVSGAVSTRPLLLLKAGESHDALSVFTLRPSLRSGAQTSGRDSQAAQSIALQTPSGSVGSGPHERMTALGTGKLRLLTSSSSAGEGSGEAGGNLVEL